MARHHVAFCFRYTRCLQRPVWKLRRYVTATLPGDSRSKRSEFFLVQMQRSHMAWATVGPKPYIDIIDAPRHARLVPWNPGYTELATRPKADAHATATNPPVERAQRRNCNNPFEYTCRTNADGIGYTFRPPPDPIDLPLDVSPLWAVCE